MSALKDRLASESTDFEELPLTGQKFLQAIVSNSTDTEESHGYITMARGGVEHKLTSLECTVEVTNSTDTQDEPP